MQSLRKIFLNKYHDLWGRYYHFKSQSRSYQAKVVGKGLLNLFNSYCAAHLFFDYIGRPSYTGGPSMLPTLAVTNDLVIEDRLSLRFTEISRGDLVTVKSPLDPLRIVCKRIIGLPGDVICVDPTGHLAPSTEHVIVPRGHVWLSGDNFSYSRDSRRYGPVPIALIQGKIRPLRDFTIYRNPVTLAHFEQESIRPAAKGTIL
ncbi:LexA/Signal peptidase [Guyanagaster necrorhizus]|uniref:LexA/Signal peptidase n=1 Tax=Guyanagaster necrorhizus TaxID=856835 RepID=A0A9P8AWG8_9AGAR|nr:LexA/Signal peptidase [Guyanagaster necrorhizus MCA 3950]KAG7450320.1 LexA/Signal peptidase [Guyanagaster necrorhizus MCA 3950]